MAATKTATTSSVIGIANQITSAGATAGNNIIRIPLMTAPFDTETMKDVVELHLDTEKHRERNTNQNRWIL